MVLRGRRARGARIVKMCGGRQGYEMLNSGGGLRDAFVSIDGELPQAVARGGRQGNFGLVGG